MKTVSLLCRGPSLKDVSLLPICDTLILVNTWVDELNDPNIEKYISSHKNIIHSVTNNCGWDLMKDNGFYEKYNVKKILLPYVDLSACSPFDTRFSHKQHQGNTLPIICDNKSLKNIKDRDGNKIPVELLTDKNIDDMVRTHRYDFCAPTSGVDCLLHSVNDLGADVVNIIGMDFYDGFGYYSDSKRDDDTAIKQGLIDIGTPEKMKLFVCNFIEKHSNVIFNIFTMAELKNDIKNLNIINVVKE